MARGGFELEAIGRVLLDEPLWASWGTLGSVSGFRPNSRWVPAERPSDPPVIAARGITR